MSSFWYFVFTPAALFCSMASASVDVTGKVAHLQCSAAEETSNGVDGYSISRVCHSRIVGDENSKYISVIESMRGQVRSAEQETLWRVGKSTVPPTMRTDLKTYIYQLKLAGNVQNGRLVLSEKTASGSVVARFRLKTGSPVSMRGKLNGRAFAATQFKASKRQRAQ